jgi:hypothetical protein
MMPGMDTTTPAQPSLPFDATAPSTPSSYSAPSTAFNPLAAAQRRLEREELLNRRAFTRGMSRARLERYLER